jgi:hypothetical protein
MGAVVWQLNDRWPVASWSSIDYFGRWKALHYCMKRFFAPILISCHEEGVLSQNTNVNAEPFRLRKASRLNVSNETAEAFSGVARWSLRGPDAGVISEGSFDVEAPPFSAVWLPEQDFSDKYTYGCYYAYQLESGENVREKIRLANLAHLAFYKKNPNLFRILNYNPANRQNIEASPHYQEIRQLDDARMKYTALLAAGGASDGSINPGLDMKKAVIFGFFSAFSMIYTIAFTDKSVWKSMSLDENEFLDFCMDLLVGALK